MLESITKKGIDKPEEMIVEDPWVIDVYDGYKIMRKLVDQASNQEFVKC